MAHYIVEKHGNRKYFFNQHYFEKIDNEEKAYFLGFIYADGYVRHGKTSQLNITLQSCDREILEKFIILVNYTGHLNIIKTDTNFKKNNEFIQLILNSRIMCLDLLKLGVMQKKSLIIEFPTLDQVPEHLIKHFLRGYFDGDGCFSWNPTKKHYPLSASFICSHAFYEPAKNIIEKHLKVTVKKHIRDSNVICVLYIGGRYQSFKFLQWLYDDSIISLNRKFVKYKNYLSWLKENDMMDQNGQIKTLSMSERAGRAALSRKLKRGYAHNNVIDDSEENQKILKQWNGNHLAKV